VSCPVCLAAAATPRLHKAGTTIFACASCGSAFWQPDAAFDSTGIYGTGYFAGSDHASGYDDYASLESSLRHNFVRRLRKLGLPNEGARLLDLGAAYGFAVAEARRLGWRAVGLEISPAAARRAAETIRAAVVAVGDAHLVPFADDCFDVVTLWDVLEHLPEPHAAMAELARVLRPGGRLVLTTGDVGSLAARVSGARWHLYTLPEHVFFYSREGVRRLLAAHGLRVERIRAEGSRYPLGYLFERLRKSLLGQAARGGAQRAEREGDRRENAAPPRWPGAGLSIPVNLFDVVTVHAVREAA
jgi:SAM-dependent methyltransferase